MKNWFWASRSWLGSEFSIVKTPGRPSPAWTSNFPVISQHALLTLCTQFKLGELVQTHTMKGALSPSSYSSLLDSDLRPGGPYPHLTRTRTTHLIMKIIIGGIHALLLGMAQAHGRTMPG